MMDEKDTSVLADHMKQSQVFFLWVPKTGALPDSGRLSIHLLYYKGHSKCLKLALSCFLFVMQIK